MAFLLVGEGPGNRPLDLSGGICPTASGMIVSNARYLQPLEALLTSQSASLGAATYGGSAARFSVGCEGRLSPEANMSAVLASMGSEGPVDEILILDATHPSLRQQCDDPLDIGPISIGVGEQVPR